MYPADAQHVFVDQDGSEMPPWLFTSTSIPMVVLKTELIFTGVISPATGLPLVTFRHTIAPLV